MYIAITTFHQELLPSTLLFSLAAQREGVPFPVFVEAMIMEITFEILREAGLGFRRRSVKRYPLLVPWLLVKQPWKLV